MRDEASITEDNAFHRPLPYCSCGLINRIRKSMYKDHMETFGLGYAAALRDAAEKVKAYADERLVLTKHPNASEDITAALRVAAKRIEALGGEQ